jgi:DNA polymerase-2
MLEHTGWILDIYADAQDGVVLWLLDEDGGRRKLRHAFPVTFYIAGTDERLRVLWRYLKNQSVAIRLSRAKRRDLFNGPRTVLAVEVPNAAAQPRLFRAACRRFPDLDYYDADIPLDLRYAAQWGVFPLAHCRVTAGEDRHVESITVLDSPWDLNPAPPPLRALVIRPDSDPFHTAPAYLHLRCEQAAYHLAVKDERRLLINLGAILKRHDPDLLLTNWGDTWLFPHLLELAEVHNLAFNPNRDQDREVLRREPLSFFTYGQVIYRGQQVHLFGRWHIDCTNAMMYSEYGLEGVYEQARVTGLRVQTVARNSPGSGITAMQMQVALRKGILVPYHKQQAERYKSVRTLMRSDRGGMIYQPLVGLHSEVGEIDFVSMYPSIMVRFNISPETVGGEMESDDEIRLVPELGIPVAQGRLGLIPETLEPLLNKRIAIKERLTTLNRLDCRYMPYKARAAALKWLLVVCFGYMGYKNARFGRIEAHEAVTAYGREALLRAKEAAEDQGFRVIHMYVDGMWVQKKGANRVGDFQPLLEEISRRTRLPVALEGIYRWVVFSPSRSDARVPVPNRYFGIFQDGSIKVRGIAARRHDAPKLVADTQMDILQLLSKESDIGGLRRALPKVVRLLRQRVAALRSGKLEGEDLLVTQRVSRELEEYKVLSPAARAAAQLEASGKSVRPGQRVRFLFTLGEPGVWAWDQPVSPNMASVDVQRYIILLLRAASELVDPLGVTEEALCNWVLSNAGWLGPPGVVGLQVKNSGLPMWSKKRIAEQVFRVGRN